MVLFGGGEVELEDVRDRRAEVAEAAVLDDLSPGVEEGCRDDVAASTAAAEALGTSSGGTVGGRVVVGVLARSGSIRISWWGGWDGGLEW